MSIVHEAIRLARLAYDRLHENVAEYKKRGFNCDKLETELSDLSECLRAINDYSTYKVWRVDWEDEEGLLVTDDFLNEYVITDFNAKENAHLGIEVDANLQPIDYENIENALFSVAEAKKLLSRIPHKSKQRDNLIRMIRDCSDYEEAVEHAKDEIEECRAIRRRIRANLLEIERYLSFTEP